MIHQVASIAKLCLQLSDLVHLFFDQLVHLPPQIVLKSTVLVIVLPLEFFTEHSMLSHDSFHLRLSPLHLLLHARDLTLDGAELILRLIEMGLKLSNMTLQGCNLIHKFRLSSFLLGYCLFMPFLKFLNILSMILLFLG